jgi:hypothetical protein
MRLHVDQPSRPEDRRKRRESATGISESRICQLGEEPGRVAQPKMLGSETLPLLRSGQHKEPVGFSAVQLPTALRLHRQTHRCERDSSSLFPRQLSALQHRQGRA